MVQSGKNAKTNPAASANFLSRLFFWWLNPLFQTGSKRRLEEDDMYEVLSDDQSERLGQELQRYWDHEVQACNRELEVPQLSKAIIRCYWRRFAVLGLFTLVEEITKVAQPVILGQVIQYFENSGAHNATTFYEALGYAAGLSLCTIIMTLLHHLYLLHLVRVGMKVRVALCHMIYKKALCLSNSAMGKTNTGQIVNLLSNDVIQFDELFIFLHYLWAGPLEVAVVVGLLWLEIGLSCLAGVGFIMFLLPTQSMLGQLFSKFRGEAAVLTDSRIRLMNEVVSGMRIIKMYAWEKPFASLVSDMRRREIAKVMMSSYLRGLNMASHFCSIKIILFLTFTVYFLLGNTISVSRVFVTVSLYSALQLTVTFFFPTAIETLHESHISVQRIQEFLLLDDIRKCNSTLSLEEKEALVEIKDLTCYWDKNVDAPSLQSISLSLKSSQLLAVIGPVGAGKSSLLSSILGELPFEQGVMKVKGQLAYASQQPWVFPGTIRSNILFGKEMDPRKYECVLQACALKKDLELLSDGDLTLIGDRGATLSGGQKARVNLARAVYQDANIYLLDDPLSAVDAEVGRHLFEQCICGLLKNKPRILVTHQLQYLRAADQIVVLKEGHMVAEGTYRELQRSGVDFTSLLKKDDEDSPLSSHDVSSRGRTLSQISVLSVKDGGEQLRVEPIMMGAEECRTEGSIRVGLYVEYLMSGASVMILLFVVCISILAQVAYIMQDWWLAYWAMEQEKLNDNVLNGTITQIPANVTKELDTAFYLSIYGGLTLATIIFGLTRDMLLFNAMVLCAQNLHNKMFNAILRAPVRFFDTNPVGRILNRFSKDIGQLDSNLPWTFVDFIQGFLEILGVIAVASSVMPWVLLAVLPLLIVFLYVRHYYLQTSRDIKRLESTTRSPVFSHLSSTLQGLWTIRAFRAEKQFQNTFDAHQDLHSEAWFLFLTTSRWLGIRLDALCSVFNIITTFSCLLLRDQLDVGSVGLALTYVVTLMGMFQWVVRQSAEVENLMTSVERVMEYTELETEAPWKTNKRPPPYWPSQGLVTFDQVSFSHGSDSPVVLKNLQVIFRPKEKVGIVGRTGAGKSSLVSALFRLAEPEGEIYIDGVLTSEIGLHDLRQKISIIPQDPVLFTGTVRDNLDPFNEHTDEDLWNVLQEVQLKSLVEELPGKLLTVLAESGSNFSVGQRQLVCLARAVLRKNRILIIDEATANVDPRTDGLIQNTIREKFQECTVLTIAHRLNTIIDSDRILVLDAGKIHAYDEPYLLLQDEAGIFYKMVQHTGKQEAAALLDAAKAAYKGKNRPNKPNIPIPTDEGEISFVIAEKAF